MKLLEAKNPLILFSNGIGDHILNIPAIRALNTLFKNKLLIIGDADLIKLLFGKANFKKIVHVEFKKSENGKDFDCDSIFVQIRKCDLFISLHPWHNDSINQLLNYYKPFWSIGFFKNFKISLPLNYNIHAADLTFQFVNFLDSTRRIEDFLQTITLSSRALIRAKKIFKCIPAVYRVLVIHGDTLPYKMWTKANFTLLTDKLLNHFDDLILFIIGSHNPLLEFVENSERVVSLIGLDLGTSLAVLKKCNYFIGVDSCMFHAADFFNLPAVVLIAETNPSEFGFRFSKNYRLLHNSKGMQHIEPSEVYSTVLELMQEINVRIYAE